MQDNRFIRPFVSGFASPLPDPELPRGLWLPEVLIAPFRKWGWSLTPGSGSRIRRPLPSRTLPEAGTARCALPLPEVARMTPAPVEPSLIRSNRLVFREKSGNSALAAQPRRDPAVTRIRPALGALSDGRDDASPSSSVRADSLRRVGQNRRNGWLADQAAARAVKKSSWAFGAAAAVVTVLGVIGGVAA